MNQPANPPALKRALGLPLLVFYGLGVTIGAGIFALIGEILGIAGDGTPLAFLVAGIVAAATARAYAILSRRYPRAGGAAVYATAGFGRLAGRIAGIGVALTAIVSSAVIAQAFAGYVAPLVGFGGPPAAIALIAALAFVAALGIRESIGLAAVITILEVATLAVVAILGLPSLAEPGLIAHLAFPESLAALNLTIAAAAVAFFAFIGFEDIVNMAEEARRPRQMGAAIAITLAVSIALYVLVAAAAAAVADRSSIAESEAPLAALFSALSGLPPTPIYVIAAVSMVNGILVQIVVVSRVFYGMASDGLLPAWLGAVDRRRGTPVRATLLAAVLMAVLVVAAPMLSLAQATGYVTLALFALVNLSLLRLAGPWRERAWGAAGALLSGGLLVYEFVRIGAD